MCECVHVHCMYCKIKCQCESAKILLESPSKDKAMLFEGSMVFEQCGFFHKRLLLIMHWLFSISHEKYIVTQSLLIVYCTFRVLCFLHFILNFLAVQFW